MSDRKRLANATANGVAHVSQMPRKVVAEYSGSYRSRLKTNFTRFDHRSETYVSAGSSQPDAQQPAC